MSERKHTPGLIKAHLNVPTAVFPGHILKTVDDPQTPIASLWEGGGTEGRERQTANAKRLEECWNALANLNPAAVAGVVEALEAVANAPGDEGETIDLDRFIAWVNETGDKARGALAALRNSQEASA